MDAWWEFLFQNIPVYTNISTSRISNNNQDKFVLMKKCRSLVEVFTTSTQKMDKLLNIQSSMNVYNGKVPVKVIQDVVTHWWSTYTMLDRLVYLKQAITALIADNIISGENILSSSEWHTIVKIIDILKPFKSAQKYLEGETYVTVSWIPHMIKNIHKKLEESLHLATDPDDQDDDVKYFVEVRSGLSLLARLAKPVDLFEFWEAIEKYFKPTHTPTQSSEPNKGTASTGTNPKHVLDAGLYV